MAHQVYLLECSNTDKKYVGMTSKGVAERFTKHIKNALRGDDTHLYRSMRKNGVDSFTYSILWQGKSKAKCAKMEMYYIQHFDTFKTGYNQTLGGAGGWCVPNEKLDGWLNARSIASTGHRNARYIDVADEEILRRAFEYYEQNGNIPVVTWQRYSSKKYGMPLSYSKCRFLKWGSGNKGFRNAMKDVYGVSDSVFKYEVTEEHKRKHSEGMKRNHELKNNKVEKEESSL